MAATALTAKVTAGINFTYGKTDVVNTIEEALNLYNTAAYTFGLGNNKAEVLYRTRVTVTTGSPNSDFAVFGTLSDIFGDTVNVEILRAIYVHNRSTTSGDNVYVGPLSASNPLLLPWVDANGRVKVGPGGTFLLDCPLDGYAIEDNADTFRIQYQGASGSIDVDVAFFGNSGDFVSSSSSSTSSASSSSSSKSASTSTSSSSVQVTSSSTSTSKSSQSSSSTSSSTVQQSGSSSSSTSSSST